ncbi:RecQ family ATP-dependent DNA helicase [Natronospirillum operosum]|uniref:ATP-dependent DNA helicase RecQ n=1 Tax=Natronospirillum operosum TaxID=2759953 RepID=A0A4Z0W830_9GAMM|nr:ATP-dependent DNA helicase RecQ [Natronospirillum operosum]TGG92897.1 RecQ family ATP-dependent DNA helicase [Natronospirillum operosum]
MDSTQQQVQHHLQNTFRLSAFRPGQQDVINTLLAGRSALAIFPTGGGKSLCYQLPALMLDGLTLVVSPLIALMKDQVDALNALGVPAARLDSSRTGEEVQAIYQSMDQGELKLLYVAPERLANERFLTRLSRLNISMMAVDEAHCVSEWGHNFRPDYLKLAQLAHTLNVGRVLALTATATPKVSEQICSNFGIAKQDHIQTGFYRPNLQIGVTPCTSEQRNQQLLELLELLNSRPAEPSIIYVTLQKTALQVADFLNRNGYRARPYHAGLKDEERSATQEAFMSGETPIVVATIAFGMGIDKSDIRAVYHYNLPKSLENYMQEIGRAGRDGEDSRCQLLACRDDLTVLENFTYGDTPDPESLAELVRWLCVQSSPFDLSTYELSQQFDVRPLVLNTLLTYLELEGVLASTAPFYTEYKLALTVPENELLERFDPARAEFLQRLFATGKAGRTWLTLKPREAAEQLGESQPRIIKALNYLEQQDLLEMKVAGLRQGYRMEQVPGDVEGLIDRMAEQFRMREERDIDRLQTVCDWAQSPGCLQQPLMQYFGETLEQACGRCSGCLGQTHELPPRHSQSVDLDVVREVMDQQHEALSQPRQLARFLCGITSPKASRARLGKQARFGALAEVPFTEVLAACEQL